jgi:hypothetical protein
VHDVRISTEPTTAADGCEQRLTRVNGYGLARAKRRLHEIAFSPLEGSVNGAAVTFELAAPVEKSRTDEGWVAVLACDAFTVTVQCGGPPPSRSDLTGRREEPSGARPP